jgi:hypothetical protein
MRNFVGFSLETEISPKMPEDFKMAYSGDIIHVLSLTGRIWSDRMAA